MATRLARGLLKGTPGKTACKTAVFKSAIATPDFRPSKKKAATITISQIWNHKPGTNEGIAIPKKRGPKTTVTAVIVIVIASFLVFIHPPLQPLTTYL